MNEPIEIYAVHESGASDSWQWIVSLARNDGQSYRLLVYQVLWDSTDENEGACYELLSLSTGEELVEFVQSVWMNDHDDGLSEQDWQQVESSIRKIDRHLAAQVGQAVQIALGHVEPEKSSKQRQIDSCISGATWGRNAYSGAGAMWASLAEKQKMNQALTAFVKEHLTQHGTTPKGTHLILGRDVNFADPTTEERPNS